MLTTPGLIAQSVSDLAQGWLDAVATQAKQNLDADTQPEQKKALEDGGGRAITALWEVGITFLEIVEYLSEPIEDRVFTNPVRAQTTTPKADVLDLVSTDFVHMNDSTQVIKAKEILLGDHDEPFDANRWFTVSTWINGRKAGMYVGKVEVRRKPGATAPNQVIPTYVNV